VTWTLDRILAATGGELVRWGTGPYRGLSTDSRQTAKGEAFLALTGPHFDGRNFVAAALERGAAAAIVGSEGTGAPSDAPVPGSAAWIRVPDGLRALGDLAAVRRRELPLRVVGITGTNGKTTTKEMVAAVLAAPRGAKVAKVAKSRGTENNLIGLPHTLLRLVGDEDFAVLEMGMNHPGEIWRLAEIARPDVGVITNVAPAHLEGLGSLANVAAAKEELALALAPTGTLVAAGGDPRVMAIAERFTGRVIVAGGEGGIRAARVTQRPHGQKVEIEIDGRRASFELRIRGAHNVDNALLAAGVGVAFGLDLDAIVAGLEAFTPPPMRLETVELASGVRVLNDAYNANPASMSAAVAALAGEPGTRKIAVLGEMWELGEESARYHHEVGVAAGLARIDRLIAVGRHASELASGALEAGMARDAVERCETAAEAAERLAGALRAGDVVLVKGSRAAKMEAIVERLGERR